MVAFNDRLRDIMSEHDITADALGKKIGLSGSIVSRWLRRNSSIMSSNLIKLAEYFGCSLDYICGRSEEWGVFRPVYHSSFAARLKQLLNQTNKSLLSISKQTALPRSRFYDWLAGTQPKSMSLITLAQYFDCTIDYLVGLEN